MTTRLPPPDASSPELAQVLAEIAGSRGIVSNVMRSLAHAPEGLRRFAQLGEYARYRSSLSEREREIVICLVGRNVPYAWAHHAPIAREAGLTDAELDAIRAGSVPPSFAPPEAALARLVLALGPGAPAAEPLFAELRRHLSPRQITDAVLIAGFFVMVATVIGAMDVQLEDGVTLGAEQERQRTRDAAR
jgi:4-carboxymuconolactone decarboxylase